MADKDEKALDTWEEDPRNPRNWSNGRKWANVLTVSLTGFLSTAGSSMPAPAAIQISKDFAVTDQRAITLVVGVYVLGLGFGPFVFAPIAELWGRQPAYRWPLFFLIPLHLGCSFTKSLSGLVVLRFFAGFCGSVGPVLGLASISDLFTPQERGRPASVYAIGPMLGPTLGTLLGSYLVLAGFRWIFRALTVATAVNFIFTFLFMRESYAPALKRKLAREDALTEAETAPPKPTAGVERKGFVPKLRLSPEIKAVFSRTFSRPPRLLFGNPVCAIFSVYYAYTYGIIYVFLVTVPMLFSAERARDGLFSNAWDEKTWGLAYIGLGVGFLTSAFTAAIAQDRIYRRLSKQNGGEGRPEYRLVLTQIGMIIFPCGLLLWGWTAQAQTHWIAHLIGLAIIAYGLMLAFNSIQVFLVDFSFPYSAAAIAAASFLRSVVAAILPIFAQDLFVMLDWGWGGTLLACIALPAAPAPLILFKYGVVLRQRFRIED